MRQILFKAKRVDNGEWIIGNLVVSEDAEERWKAIIIPTFDSNMFTKGGAKGDLGFENWCRVDENTICQYTGLTDKNGDKIWENDIVNGHEKRGAAFFQCVVKYNDRKARFDVEAMGCMFPLCLEEYDEDFFMNGLDYEVIGNTFENADLLKGE